MTLLEYVKGVKKLEENLYISEQLMQNMKKKLATQTLETANLRPLPVSMPKQPEYEEYPDSSAYSYLEWLENQHIAKELGKYSKGSPLYNHPEWVENRYIAKDTKKYPDKKNFARKEYPAMPEVPELRTWKETFTMAGNNTSLAMIMTYIFGSALLSSGMMGVYRRFFGEIQEIPAIASLIISFIVIGLGYVVYIKRKNAGKLAVYNQQMKEYDAVCAKIDAENAQIDAEYQHQWDEIDAYNKGVRERNKAEYDKLKQRAEEKRENYYRGVCAQINLLNYKKRSAYQNAMEKYRADVKAAEDACEQKKQQQRTVTKALSRQLVNLEELHQKLTAALKQAYDTGIIYPKYRGLVPVTMFTEYLEAGRCDSLTGTGGAYNLYEKELFANRIINKLDEISEKLDMVRENQYSVYESMERMNRQISLVNAEIEKQGDRLAAKLSEQNELIEKHGRLVERRNELLEDQNWIASEHSRMLERGMEYNAEIQRAAAEKQNDLLYENNELRKYSNSVLEDIRQMQEVEFISNLP